MHLPFKTYFTKLCATKTIAATKARIVNIWKKLLRVMIRLWYSSVNKHPIVTSFLRKQFYPFVNELLFITFDVVLVINCRSLDNLDTFRVYCSFCMQIESVLSSGFDSSLHNHVTARWSSVRLNLSFFSFWRRWKREGRERKKNTQ